MTKNLIMTVSIGDIYKEMEVYTHPSIKSYAKRIGADFICVDKTNCTTPHWEKFVSIYKYLNIYERILYIDTDTLVRDDCPNIFDKVPVNQLGLFDERRFTSQRDMSLYEACKAYGETIPRWNGHYYNSGIMVIPRHFKELFKKPEKEIFNFYEQGYFNLAVCKFLEASGNEYAVCELPYQFNRMTCIDQFTGEERFSSYIIHYAGYPSLEFVLSLIKKDIKKWKEDSPNYKYKKHILINVQGGLGDQICAEPAIRFMKKYIYPNEDINVITHWPRIFKHLDIPVFTHDEFRTKPDTPYFHVLSLPGPETLMWMCVSHLMCNSVDYVAMALLKRTLPNSDKQIQLTVYENELKEVKDIMQDDDLDDYILIHPGKHWDSKTFPVEWWQEIVDSLAKEKLKICVIGKEETTRGTVNIKIPQGVKDIRNLLNLGMLIALISKAKILVSNDSAPIHIAGAFDNHIILIPTCKHPDHVMPFRYNTQYYKSKVMYKKLMCFEYESSPTTVYGSSAHFVPGDFSDYLPEAKEVVNEVLNIVKGEK